MNELIAYCGMDCGNCPVYTATQANDDAMRQNAAAIFSKLFKTEIPVSAINCDGCKSENGRLFGHCQTCEVRSCTRGKNLESCAFCDDYSCGKLDAQLAAIPLPQPRERLEELRRMP